MYTYMPSSCLHHRHPVGYLLREAEQAFRLHNLQKLPTACVLFSVQAMQLTRY